MLKLKRRFRRFLLNIFYRRLWTQIALILLVLATIPMVLLGILFINTSKEAVSRSVLANHKEIVTSAGREIKLFIEKPKELLKVTAALLSAVYPASWKQETILVELILHQPIFMRVSSVDLTGKEMASSELGRGLRWDYPQEAFQEIKKRKFYISRPKILDNYSPYLTMAVPIKRKGRIIGGLIADVDLREMWKIVDNIKIGTTGRAFLISDKGILIAHQDKKRVLKVENLSGQEDVRAVLAGRSEAVELKDKRGKKWISSYAPISGLGWGIILRQSEKEAYVFSKIMIMQSWIIIILSEAMVVLVSIFMAKVLARPIKKLALSIKRVAAGDLDHKIESKRRDEIGELIRSFNDMTKKLRKARVRERFSVIGEVAAWITHELKNSLVSIKAFIQLFPQRHNDENFVDKFSKLLPGEIKRWEHMLKELSDFSYYSELRKENINLNQLIYNLLEIMEEKFVEKRVNIKYEPKSDSIIINADSERLKQVFMNLIINAINAMSVGDSLTVSIELMDNGSQDAPAQIKIKFEDTGCGMSKKELEKIFKPFHTTTKEGAGLGLSISRKIVEQHGGEIQVQSQLNIGTTFTIVLPLIHKESSQLAQYN
ncbi:MAG: ATP-binding protein [Omnitrophica bacterium]|nr:ATP-binding protein [Candidatus Omnitrophota bacterium]